MGKRTRVKWRELDPGKLSNDAVRLKTGLASRVIGQPTAIDAVTTFHQIWLSGLNDPGRPVASFLFLGPTGTGKTRLVEALAEQLFHDRRAMLKVDCAEFSHSHEIARLIGSPPGYLGHRDTPPFLSQENLNRHHTRQHPLTLLLFDEIEKANDALWMLLLGILDKGTLTLGTNEQVDLTRTVIFMTSNVGAEQFDGMYEEPLGFQQATDPSLVSMTDLTETVHEATRRVFSPEFLNRIDRKLIFNSLGAPELRRILDLELSDIRRRVQSRMELDVRWTAAARRFMLKHGTNPRYGARPLRGLLEAEVLFPIASLISSSQLCNGDRLQIDATRSGDKLVYKRAQSSTARSVVSKEELTREGEVASPLAATAGDLGPVVESSAPAEASAECESEPEPIVS